MTRAGPGRAGGRRSGPVPAGVPLRPPDPPLVAGGIALRTWRDDDAAAIAAACGDPEIRRWLPLPDPYSIDDARAFIETSARQWADGSAANMAIADRTSDAVLGAIGLHVQSPIRFSVGYWVAPDARERGVATLATRLVARWAFDAFPIARLELYTLAGNAASERVAIKAGFTYEGMLRRWLVHRRESFDASMFSMLREEAPDLI
jgi:RimJ/RimL family protein N-acetyltransferase